MSRRVLVDTGPLVALRNTRDQHRDRVIELSRGLPSPLLTCWPVLTEVAFLLRAHPGQFDMVLKAIARGSLSILPMTDRDAEPIAPIMAKYADQPLSLADASLMHLAEREGVEEVFTVDAKDFSVYRTASGQALRVRS